MNFYWIFLISLVTTKCAGDEVNANIPDASTYNSAYASVNNIEGTSLLSQSSSPSAASSALNSLAALIKGAGSNYIIDASSLGGQVLISKDGRNLTPVTPSQTSVLSQLLKNIPVPLKQGQPNNIPAEHATNSKSLSHTESSSPRPTAFTKTLLVPKPYPVTITRQVAIPKPYPVTITRPVPVPFYIRVPNFIPVPNSKPKPYKVTNHVPNILPNSIVLKILRFNPDYDDDDDD